MPKLIQLANFAKAGINSDLMPWDLPGDFLTEISNVRISRGRLSPFGGEETWATLPVDFKPGYLMNNNANSGSYWMIPGLDAVYVFDGAIFSDISSAGGYPGILDESLWQGDMLSRVAVLNHPSHFPEYWPDQNPATLLLPLPWDATNTWADVNESCRIIRTHKQFMFALNLVSNGEEIPDGVRWSAPADINSVPPTWDPLDVTQVAGLTTLGGNGGSIVDGKPLRDAFCVYRKSGISVFDYVGGNFVWQIRHLSTTIGLVSPNSIVEVKGVHYFIGDGDILVNDGNSIESLLHNRLRKRFIANYDADNFRNSYAILNSVASEVWFCIPSSGHVYPNLVYIYNWRDDTWAIRDMPEAPYANYGTEGSAPVTWDDKNTPWDGQQGSWGQRQLSPLDDTLVAVTSPEDVGQSGRLVFLDYSLSNNEVPFDSVIERTGFALEGMNNVTTITRIYPHMRGPGSVYIQVGSQDRAGAPVRWKPEVLYNPDTDRKIDFRTTGELHCFRFRQLNDTSFWELSGIDVEYVNSGVR